VCVRVCVFCVCVCFVCFVCVCVCVCVCVYIYLVYIRYVYAQDIYIFSNKDISSVIRISAECSKLKQGKALTKPLNTN
jgi:hypothetical protein